MLPGPAEQLRRLLSTLDILGWHRKQCFTREVRMADLRPVSAGARGPVRKVPPSAPTGYRVDDRRRFELHMAGAFTGRETLQGVIDLAVDEFLARLRKAPGFAAALHAAEAEQRRRAGVRSTDS
jgi:hypothetical protein